MSTSVRMEQAAFAAAFILKYFGRSMVLSTTVFIWWSICCVNISQETDESMDWSDSIIHNFKMRSRHYKHLALNSNLDDPTQLSQLLLRFLLMDNHSPGGAKSESYVGCQGIVGFLGTPFNCIKIVFMKALYPLHLKWSALLMVKTWKWVCNYYKH
jgi:hypothetical protein